MSSPAPGSPTSPHDSSLPSNPPPALALPAPPQPSTNPRRLPPPCWSHDETVALIDAYCEKWYSLRRGNLKANHWQEVADAVAMRCPAASPPKTAVQCRHKMEKLRKRYRTEIQRARSMPVSRFSSSWVHFKRMDAMEKGPQAAKPDNNSESDGNDEEEDDNDDDNNDFVNNSNNQSYYPEIYKNGSAAAAAAAASAFVNTRNIHKLYRNGIGNMGSSVGNSVSVSPGGVSGGGVGAPGFRIRIPTGVSIAQPGPKFYGKVEHQKYGGEPNFGVNPGPKVNYGSGSGFGSGRVMRGSEEMGVVAGRKREREPMEEMVAAIKVMGDGFVRVEQMKMEMAREIETMRMEMEMKRTEMILESQQRIVEAFAKAFAEKKPKRVPSPDS